MGNAVIDQPTAPAGRTRCVHDLLNGECAWCAGIDASWLDEDVQ